MSDEPARPGSVEIVLHPAPGMTAHIEGTELPYLVITGPYSTVMVMPPGPDITDADTASADAIAQVTAEYAARLRIRHNQQKAEGHEADVHP